MKLIISNICLTKPNLTTILFAFITSAILIGLVLLIHFQIQIPIGRLTRDPVAIVEAPVYTGFFSQLGIFFWAFSAAICLFCALLMPKSELRIKSFYFFSGLLVLLLGLDDIFLLHEVVFPFLGIPEKITLLTYVVLALIYGITFFTVILQTDFILLVIAALFFGISVGLDLSHITGINPYLWEDGAKMIGIVSWFSYLFRSAYCTFANLINGEKSIEGKIIK